MRPVFLAAVLALWTAGCFSHSAPKAPEIGKNTPRVSVMTYNVNFGLAGDPETVQAAAKAAENADVVCFQETNAAWERALRWELGSSHPYARFIGHPVAGGLGVMSKLPIESVEFLPAKDWFPAQRVVLSTPIGKLQVLNVHLRPPVSDSGSVVRGYFTTGGVRMKEIEAFAAKLDPDMPTLIMGDFNENEAGQAVMWLKTNRSMASALPQFQPKAKTWRWKAHGVTLQNRYDHLVYDARLRPVKAEVVKAGRSDHLPVVGTFVLSATPVAGVQ